MGRQLGLRPRGYPRGLRRPKATVPMLGQQIGCGAVVALLPISGRKNGAAHWLWRCNACGTERALVGYEMRRDPPKSCLGCHRAARERARLLGALQWRAWFLEEAWRKDVFERFLDEHCLDDTDYNDPVEP